MRMPGNTRDGKLEAPIEPGARWNIEPCDSRTAAKLMPLHQAGKTAALADADHVHFVVGLELVHQHAVAGLEVARAAVQPCTSRTNLTPSALAFFKCPPSALLIREALMNSTRPNCTAS